MANPPANQQAPKQELVIDRQIDKSQTQTLAINSEVGGIAFQNMGEVTEFAKLMAASQGAVPAHCRNQPGVCLGILIQAVEWRMSPYAVANKSYVVNDRLSYESQLIHAVIEQRAPITARLRHSFSGQANSRRCKVWATAKGETEPLEYESPEFGTIQPKNSPLWKTKPDLQLFYNTSRDWARMYFPDVILGVYADDELAGFAATADVKVAAQLPPPKSRAEFIRQQIETEEQAKAAAAEEPAAATTDETPDETPIRNTVPVEQAAAEPAPSDRPKPPTIPQHMSDFAAAIFKAEDDEAVKAAFDNHVRGNSTLSDDDYRTGEMLRDWKLGIISAEAKPASGDPTKGKSELFPNSPAYK